jgi:hypothetical protein
LFSAEAIAEEWSEVKGHKDEKCTEIAGKRDISRISKFIHNEFSTCKQHMYTFETDVSVGELIAYNFPDLELIAEGEGVDGWALTYIANIPVTAFLDLDPPQKLSLEYLLPVKFEFYKNYILIRFIKFARSVKFQNIPADKIFIHKNDHEKNLLSGLKKELQDNSKKFSSVDIHRGVKRLWDTDVLDSIDIHYKTDHSKDSKTMDDKRGIKQYNVDRYNEIKNYQFLNGLFITIVEKPNISAEFGVNWAKGFITFNKFSKIKEELDNVVRNILKNNA